MVSVILLMIWVLDEVSYDRFNTDHENTFRIILTDKKGIKGSSSSPAPLKMVVEANLPEVSGYARMVLLPEFTVANGNNSFFENRIIAADPDILDILTIPLLSGSKTDALINPGSMIISKTMAIKYFGKVNVTGESLKLNNRENYTISAVMNDIPHNSHIHFDFILPLESFLKEKYFGTGWGSPNFSAYLKLTDNTDPVITGRKITGISGENGCSLVTELGYTFQLQRITDAHLNPCLFKVSNEDIGDKRTVIIFSLVAFIILIIACFNFINLSTAMANERLRIAGVKKILGADKKMLITQFISESLILSAISSIFSLILAGLMFPLFNELTGKNLSIADEAFSLIPFMVLMVIISSLLAGLYPAIFISNANPLIAIRKDTALSANPFRSKAFFRKILVLFQFIVSIILISVTLIINKQYRFAIASSYRPGKDKILYLPVAGKIAGEYENFKSRLLENPNIVSVCIRDCLPNEINNNTTAVYWDEKTEDQNDQPFVTTCVTVDYLRTLGIDITGGRNFRNEDLADTTKKFILNREAVRLMGLKDPVGRYLKLYRERGVIIGIAENQIFRPVTEKIRGEIFHLYRSINPDADGGKLLVRLSGDLDSKNLENIIKYTNSIWNSVNQGIPFVFGFLDDTLAGQYKMEKNTAELVSGFALLSILISSLGLIGLIFLSIRARTKEIGLRKINGATTSKIILLLSGDFILLNLIANIISWPVAYIIINMWLRNYYYKTPVTIWLFITAAFLVLTITLFTLIFEAYKAANSNPVDSLRTE